MNITPVSTNINISIPQNERANAAKIKEIMPEAEFTGLSANVRVDANGGRWFLNNDPYTKTYSKYDAYAYEWTVNTSSEDYRSSYTENHPTENMGFTDFLSYVKTNGLDAGLNASAIRADMYGTNSSDYTTLSQQTDYLAAYYCQLENHINLNFTGAEKDEQMSILSATVSKAMSDVADAYSEYAGGFLEQLGQAGEKEKIRSSVTQLMSDKVNSYRDFIAENPDFANLKGTEDEWLTGSHRFMTSELQKAYSASGKSADGTGTYSENDLLYIGKIASSLPTDLSTVASVADEETIGFALGTVMVKTLELGKQMSVGNNALNTVKSAISTYQQNYIDLINTVMERRREQAMNAREREGYDPLDNQAVMSVADKMLIEYENTASLIKSLFKGVAEGYTNHMDKLNSGSNDKQLRYNENNQNFWLNMYSALDKGVSTSKKIENDALIFSGELGRKNLSVDMGFNALGTGYFTFSGYSAKATGKVISEFIG